MKILSKSRFISNRVMYTILLLCAFVILWDVVDWPPAFPSFSAGFVITALLLVRNKTFNIEKIEFLNASRKYRLFILAFALFYGLSFLTLNQSIYRRDFLFFIFISICSLVTFLWILMSNDKMNSQILVAILLIAFMLRASTQIITNSLFGEDVWYFSRFVQDIQITGYLPGSAYQYWPVSLLFSSTAGLIFGINNEFAFPLFTTIVETFSLLVVFIIAKKILNSKLALASALILAISTQNIFLGQATIAQSFSLFLFIFSFYTLVFLKENRKFFIPFLLSFVALLFTNSLSAFAFTILLPPTYMLLSVFPKSKKLLSISVVLFCGMTLISHWMYISSMLGFALEAILKIPAYSEISRLIVSQPAPVELNGLLNNLLSYLSLFFVILSGTYFLRQTNAKYANIKYFIIICYAILWLVPFGAYMLSFDAIIPNRWAVLTEFFQAILFGAGLFVFGFILSTRVNRKIIVAFICVIFLMFSFLSVTSEPAAIDSYPWRKNMVPLLTFYDSEVKAAQFFASKSANIKTDIFYNQIFLYKLNKTIDCFRKEDITAFSLTPKDIGVLRERTLETEGILVPFERTTSGYMSLLLPVSDEARGSLMQKNRIFDNGETLAFRDI